MKPTTRLPTAPWWRSFTEPSPAVTNPVVRRRAQDLATVLLIFIPGELMAVLAAALLTFPSPNGLALRIIIVGTAGAILLEGAYYLSRTVHTQWAAGLAIAALEGAVLGFLAASPAATSEGTLLAFLLVPVAVAVVALPPPSVTALGITNLVVPVALVRWMPTLTPPELFPGAVFLLPGTGLLIALAWSSHGDHVELVRQAAALQDRDGRIQAIYEATPEALVLHREGRILDANPAFRRMFQVPSDHVEGLAVMDLLAPEERDRLRDDPPWGTTRPTEVQAYRRDGTTFDAVLSTRPLMHATSAAWVTVFRDVTSENRSRRTLLDYASRLRRSNAELSSFATVLAHDLQEPVRDIARYATLIERNLGEELEERDASHLQFLVGGARRIHDLLTDLLMLTEIGRWEGDPPAVELEAALDHVLSQFDERIRSRGARVTRGKLPRVRAQQHEIELVLEHLVANALKFQEGDAPAVHVDATPRNGAWMITVEDQGPGVAAQYRELVFQPFERLQTREESEGTGIGLAICRKVVERHGGRIWMEEPPGGGARVCFTLPAVAGT